MKVSTRPQPFVIRTYFGFITLVLSGCGAGKSFVLEENVNNGFSSQYTPPPSNFDDPKTVDPNFKILEPGLSYPYWISSIEMDEGVNRINQILADNGQLVTFSFPTAKPKYLPVSIMGWMPANEQMISASREIFSKLREVLDIDFKEIDPPTGNNNLAISQSIQVTTSGFSYYPNNHYELGSDIFISKDYSSPSILKVALQIMITKS